MAFAFLGAAPNILEHYSPLDLAAVVHAVIVGWNQVAGGIAGFLENLLDLPDIHPDLVTALMLALAIGPAWSWSILQREWGQHKGAVQNTAFGVRVVIALLETLPFSLFAIAMPVGTFLWWVAFVPLILALATALARLPAYRHGFLFALGVLAAMESVYLLSTERVQAAFDGFVCQHEEAAAPRCEPEVLK